MFKLNKFYIACCLLGLAIYTTPALANVCFAPSGGCYDLNGNYVESDRDSPVTLTDCAGFNYGKLEEGPGWNCQTCVQASGATLYKCEKNKCSSSYNILKNQDEEPKERPGWECVSCWSGYDKFWYCPKHYCDPKYGPLKVSSSASPFNCSDTCPHGDDILYNCFCDSEHVEKGGSCVRECDANLHREYNPSTDTCDCESDYVERNGSCVHRDYSADCQAVVDSFVAKSYSPLSNSDCKALKVRLGISKCIGSTDYWAGAVKACGGVDFVPNKEELTKLAQCMYNSSSLASSIYGRRNTSYLEVLGLSTDDYVFVWSNTQSKKNTMSIVRMFALDKSIPYWAERDGSKYYIGNGTDPTDWENTSILSQTLCRRDGETPNSTCNPDEGMYYTEAECKAAHNIAWNSSFTRMWAAVVNNLIPIKEAFAAKPNVSVAIDSPSVVDTGSGYMISVGGKDCPCPKTGPGSGQATGQYDANGHATYYDLSDCCRALKDLNSDLNKLEDTITDSVDLTYQCKYDTTKKCWYAVVSGGGDGCYYDTVAQCKAAGYTYTAEERWWMQDENMTHECEPCNCGGTEMNKCVPVDVDCSAQYKSQCDSWGGTLKSSTTSVTEDVCHAVFGQCDNKYWYCLKPGCSDDKCVGDYNELDVDEQSYIDHECGQSGTEGWFLDYKGSANGHSCVKCVKKTCIEEACTISYLRQLNTPENIIKELGERDRVGMSGDEGCYHTQACDPDYEHNASGGQEVCVCNCPNGYWWDVNGNSGSSPGLSCYNPQGDPGDWSHYSCGDGRCDCPAMTSCP